MTNFRFFLKDVATIVACFAVTLGAMTGCKKDKPEETGSIPVNLRADISPALIKSASTLKVANDQWETGDQVGIFMKRTGQWLTTQEAVYGNVETSIAIDGALTADTEMFYPNEGNVDFIAYYPYTAPLGAGLTLPVNVDEREILYSNNVTNQAPTTTAVTLEFEYSLAKLEITVVGGANSTFTPADLAAMTVNIEGMYTQATLQLADGAFTNPQAMQTVAMQRTSTTVAAFETLALPTDEEITFIFNIAGATYRHTTIANYEAANLYILNFALDFKLTATLLNAIIIKRKENIRDIFVEAVDATLSNSWTQKTDFGGGVRSGAVGFSIGNKGYIGIGYSRVGYSTLFHQDFWEYDPVSDVWTQKADFVGGGRELAVGFSIDNKGYVGLGTIEQGFQDYQDFWEYDPIINNWIQKANFAGGNRHFAIGFSIGNKGYVGTGSKDFNPQQDFWEYDPVSDVWTKKADFPGGESWYCLGFSIGNKGYVFLSWNSFTTDVWEYDPVSDVWSQKADITPRLTGLAGEQVGFSIENKGYVFHGGLNNFWEYDPISDVCSLNKNFGEDLGYSSVGFSIGNKGYVGTGQNNNGICRQDFWEFTP